MFPDGTTLVAGLASGGTFGAFTATTNSAGRTLSYNEINAPPFFGRVQYDPATGDYIIYTNPSNSSDGPSRYVFSASTINTHSIFSQYVGNSNFTSYTIPADADGRKSDLFLYKIGSTNTEISLTYVSFGAQIFDFPGNSNRGTQVLFVYGVPTAAANIPLSGTASYTGIVSGSGDGLLAFYSISGTSGLTANFSTSTLSTSITFTGTPGPGSLVGTLPARTFSGSANIGAGEFHGMLTNPTDMSSSGGFNGRFYGPAAQEFGYNFTANDGAINAAGVAIGGR